MFELILAAVLSLPPRKSDAVIGVTAIHLESGKRLSARGSERFPMGSVYKFPIALAVLKRVDAGSLSLDQIVTIEPHDFAPGWSPLRDRAHGRPIVLTLGELIVERRGSADLTRRQTSHRDRGFLQTRDESRCGGGCGHRGGRAKGDFVLECGGKAAALNAAARPPHSKTTTP